MVQFAHYLGGKQNLETTIKLAASIIDPTNQCKQTRVPNPELVRQWGIKLDAINMLHERKKHEDWLTNGYRIARYFMWDSSPQGRFNYFVVRQEIIVRLWSCLLATPFDPFGGFDHQRTCMPLTTVTGGHSGTANKTYNFIHCLYLEAWVAEGGIDPARKQAKNATSDQAGPETRAPKVPFANITEGRLGDDETRAQLERIKRGEATFAEEDSRQCVLLPNSLDINGVWHIMFNNLERCIKATDEWPQFEEHLKGFCKSVGNDEHKGVVLVEMYDGASNEERAQMHRWTHEVLDWHWEELEIVLTELVDIWVHFPGRWQPTAFPDPDAKHVRTTTAAVNSSMFSYMQESYLLICCAVGNEARWILGCPCHPISEDPLTGRGKKSRKSNSSREGGGCKWMGKRAGNYALGHARVQAQNVKTATTLRFRIVLLKYQNDDMLIFHRITTVTSLMQAQWAEEHIYKFMYFDHIPAKWCGCFGQYLGYSRDVAKQCARECIAEALFREIL